MKFNRSQSRVLWTTFALLVLSIFLSPWCSYQGVTKYSPIFLTPSPVYIDDILRAFRLDTTKLTFEWMALLISASILVLVFSGPEKTKPELKSKEIFESGKRLAISFFRTVIIAWKKYQIVLTACCLALAICFLPYQLKWQTDGTKSEQWLGHYFVWSKPSDTLVLKFAQVRPPIYSPELRRFISSMELLGITREYQKVRDSLTRVQLMRVPQATANSNFSSLDSLVKTEESIVDDSKGVNSDVLKANLEEAVPEYSASRALSSYPHKEMRTGTAPNNLGAPECESTLATDEEPAPRAPTQRPAFKPFRDMYAEEQARQSAIKAIPLGDPIEVKIRNDSTAFLRDSVSSEDRIYRARLLSELNPRVEIWLSVAFLQIGLSLVFLLYSRRLRRKSLTVLNSERHSMINEIAR